MSAHSSRLQHYYIPSTTLSELLNRSLEESNPFSLTAESNGLHKMTSFCESRALAVLATTYARHPEGPEKVEKIRAALK